MMYFGRYSPELVEVFRRFVNPGDTVLDIGAQVGYFSLLLASLVGPSGCVCSFEPDPRPRAWLERSAAMNEMGWLRVFSSALSSTSGEIQFYVSPQLGWSTAAPHSHLGNLKETHVQAAPYDALVEGGSVPRHVHFAKIDVEGFEVRVLRGMERTLRESRPVLVVEVNPAMLSAAGESPKSLIESLRDCDYRIYEIQRENRGYSQMPNLRLAPAAELVVGDILCLPAERDYELAKN